MKKSHSDIHIGPKWIAYFVFSLLVISGLIFAVVKLYGMTQSAAAERDDAFVMLTDAQDKLESRNIEMFDEKLKSSFDQDQLTAMTEQFVDYELYINNRKMEDQTIVYSQTPTIQITFYERFNRGTTDIFPESILYMTSKTKEDVLKDKIKLYVTDSEYTMDERVTDEGIRTDIIFSNVKAGEIITLDLEFAFSELLGLGDSSIEIFYNVTAGD